MRNDIHPMEFVEAVRANWLAGLPVTEIGHRLGVTRNVIVGVAHRNDFPARPSPLVDPALLLARRKRVVAAWNAQPRFRAELAAALGLPKGVVSRDLCWARRQGWGLKQDTPAMRSERARLAYQAR